MLNFLLTKPRTTYLARLRNPNPAMPDYQEHKSPFTLEEYETKNGSPFEAHEAGQAGAGAGPAVGKGEN